MDQKPYLVLIDADTRRRAQISHALGTGIHVEPFESIGELGNTFHPDAIALVNDAEDLVGSLLRELADAGEWLPVIAYSENPTTERIAETILAGAMDYMTWPFDTTRLGERLSLVAKRAAGIGAVRRREVSARKRVHKLTRREREVLSGVASGLSNRLIGERLCISPRTVEIHRANMLNKMDAGHTSEAIRIAIDAELVD